MSRSQTDDSRAAVLATPGCLDDLLARAIAGVVHARVQVALICGRASASALTCEDLQAASANRAEPMRLGCVAKLLTATLARRAFANGTLAPDDCVSRWLGSRATRAPLRGVTVRHLLEHMHGLDDSALVRIPLGRDGFLDAEGIVMSVSAAPRLAPPGAIYSYGSAGAGLIAALLERRAQRAYAALVRDELFAPLGIDALRAAGASDETVCPATGGTLALGAMDLVRFLAHAAIGRAERWPCDGRAGAFGSVTALPGWNPLERGVYLGWKCHGHGWFGHQSAWPEASIFARVHPERRVALVVMSRDQRAAVVAGRMLGEHLRELFDLRLPADTGNVALRSCEGVYEAAAWSVTIALGERGLELRARRRLRDVRSVDCMELARASGAIFFARPPRVESFAYVQFIVRPGTDEVAYLWNGRFVLRKVTAPRDSGDRRRGSLCDALVSAEPEH